MFIKCVSRKLFFALLIMCLGACSGEADLEVSGKLSLAEISGLLFSAQSSRIQGQGNYSSVSGRMVFTLSGDENQGIIKITYTQFFEPALCSFGQTCACSGVVYASYKPIDEQPSSQGEVTQTPYDPQAPPEVEPVELDSNVLALSLQLTIDQSKTNLSLNCPTQLNRAVSLYVYPNKSLIYVDSGHQFQFERMTF